MARKINLPQGVKLSPKHAVFLVEYLKDFSPRRAAEAAGFDPDTGYALIKRPDISMAMELIILERLDDAMIDADWLLYEMVDNHRIARQQGNITASNTALGMVAKHKRVDAFAADKIKVSTDADVVDRLAAARKRVAERDEQDTDSDISFL